MVRLLPFAQGGRRRSYHLWDQTEENRHLVGKESLAVSVGGGEDPLAFHRDFLRCHSVAKDAAKVFNAEIAKVRGRLESRGDAGED